MAQDKLETWRKLAEIWQNKNIQVLSLDGVKYAVFSDLHMGDGSKADDFVANENVLIRALNHYKDNEYTIILLGDIEDLWQFKMEKIHPRYKYIYDLIESFGTSRIFRIYGNHDLDWRDQKGQIIQKLSEHQKAAEAIIIKDKKNERRILLLHGHQGDLLSDKLGWFSRIIVRWYRKIEPFIKIDPRPSATRSQITKDYESIYYSWAKENKVIVICGHSHRAIFASKSYIQKLEDDMAELQADILANIKNKAKVKELILQINTKQRQIIDERKKCRDIDEVEPYSAPSPCYFNDGCGIYTDGITAIEIDGNTIKLKKWGKTIIEAQIPDLYSEGELDKIINQVIA